jgi:hypothetical protein
MLLKFRLEMDVILDQDTEIAVIELARQHYRREGESPPLTSTEGRTGSRLKNSSKASTRRY